AAVAAIAVAAMAVATEAASAAIGLPILIMSSSSCLPPSGARLCASGALSGLGSACDPARRRMKVP
ncbi:MAG TPA: hypothetical protein VGK12_02800, partial [Actinomycetota bacterium]